MHIFNAGGSARWGPVPFMKKSAVPKNGNCAFLYIRTALIARAGDFGNERDDFLAVGVKERQCVLRLFGGTGFIEKVEHFAFERHVFGGAHLHRDGYLVKANLFAVDHNVPRKTVAAQVARGLTVGKFDHRRYFAL